MSHANLRRSLNLLFNEGDNGDDDGINTHADDSRGSKAFTGVGLCVCMSICP